MLKHAICCAALAVPLCAHAAEQAPPAANRPATNAGTQPAAAIQGQVRDALGRPLAGARVTLQTVTGASAGETRSDGAGQFAFAGVAAGTYAVLADQAGYQTGSAIVTVDGGTAAATITLAAIQALSLDIAATRLEKARSGVTATGSSRYRFDAADIDKLPQGDNTAFNQVLLQAPGVVNDSFGALHIRGDHGNNQYRVNGVILPEGISGFGQALDTRFAQRIDLLTGALPAQYGLRTAGVIEIETKHDFRGSGRLDLYGGSNRTFNPSLTYGNSDGALSWFVDGSYLTNNAGIEKPTPGANPLHDTTEQYKGFGYLSYLLNDTTKLSFMFGSYDGRFQIPNNPGQTPDPNNLGILAQLGLAGYSSATLNDQQREINRYAIAALQSSLNDRFDYQLALFTRYSSVHYLPDLTGNLVFNGVAPDVFRSSTSAGVQADGSYRLNETHTLRMGLLGSSENIRSDNTSTVFPVNPGTGLVSGPAYAIVDNNPKNGNTLFGLYLQDEWKASRKLTINYGARYDQVNAFVNEHQLSPRLGVVYQASAQTAWHAGFARYFTPPPTELVSSKSLALFQNTTNAPTVAANSPVRSERANYFDAGVTHQLTSALSLGLDSFYKKSSNLIDEGQFGPALIMAPYNYAQGKVYGIELSSSYQSGNFSGYANLARTVSLARNIVSSQYLFDQATLDYIANNWVNVDHQQALTMSLGGSYLYAGTLLSANLMFQSGLRNGFANTGSLPGYSVLNLGASSKFVLAGIGKVEGRVALTNALDQSYLIRDGSGIGVGAPQYGLRRGVFVGVAKPL